VFFKRKNGLGSFSTQDFGTTKSSGSGNGFEIKTKLLVLRCFYHWSGKERKRRDTKTAIAGRHPLCQEHEARRKFCPSLKSGGIAHSAATGFELIVSTQTTNPIIIPYVFNHKY